MSPPRILVVEDELVTAKHLQMCLSQLGYEVRSLVRTAAEAVAKVGEELPDLVLMDVVLEGEMDGIDAAREIRSRFDIPIVFLTAYSGENIMERAKTIEPHGYLLKPFRADELRTTIDMALYKHKTERKLKETEEWYRKLINAMDNGLVVLDENAVIIFVNDRLCEVGEYAREELIGHSIAEFKDAIDVDLFLTQFARHKEGVAETFEFSFTTRERRKVPTIVSPRAIFDADGRFKGAFAVLTDISDRKRMEEEVTKLNEELERRVLERTGELWEVNRSLEEEISERKRLDETILRRNALLDGINTVLRETLTGESDEDVASACLRVAEELTGSKFGWIGEMNELGGLDKLAISDPGYAACRIEGSGAVLKPKNLPVRGIWGSVFREEQSTIIDHPASHPDWRGVPEGHPDIESFLGTPLKRHGKTFGMFALANKEGGYTESDVRDLEALSAAFVEALLRKRTETALAQSEKRYRSLFEDSKDGVYVNAVDGTLLEVNQSLLNMFGFNREEIIGMDASGLYVNPDDRTKFQREMENHGFVKDFEVTFRRKDGTEMDCLMTSSVRRAEDGTIIGYQGTVRDVTEEKSLRAQLLHSQKMEAIGTLAGGIAHDFNNLLTVVRGYSELVLTDENLGEMARSDLQKVYDAAQVAADLVQRLLTFSRKVQTRPRPINLNDQVRQVEKLLLRAIPKMITVELSLGDDLAPISADPAQIEQVLMNLVVNARDAMPNGGRLFIETRNANTDGECSRESFGDQPGQYVMLKVSDTGHGMDEETLKHIFEPFYTTKEMGKSTGLGLSIVHGIVRQHGGHVNCASRPGLGTTFEVSLPVMRAKAEVDADKREEVPTVGTETLLLVDDEESIRDLGRRFLEKAGYKVLTAENAPAAIEMYRKEKDGIALVLLDLIMPDMGGERCLEELLAIEPQVKVLIASGYSPDGPARDFIESRARGFVNKPYKVKELLRTIRGVLEAK